MAFVFTQGVLKVRKRVTLMVFTVSAIFGICWNTDLILHCIERFGTYKLSRYVIPISHTMLMFNAAVNPFAYALISQRFRRKIKILLCCFSCSSPARVLPSRQPLGIEMANNISSRPTGNSKEWYVWEKLRLPLPDFTIVPLALFCVYKVLSQSPFSKMAADNLYSFEKFSQHKGHFSLWSSEFFSIRQSPVNVGNVRPWLLY